MRLLCGESEKQPQTFVELRRGIVVTGWAQVTVGETLAYSATLAVPTWDSVDLDIVAVDTERRRLARAADADTCAVTTNTFYHDTSNAILYIQVAAAEVPLVDATETAVIVARPGIMIGTDAVTLPILGPDLLTNGGFDDGGVAGWTVPTGLATTVSTFDPAGNDRCLILTSHDVATAAAARQDVTTVAGVTYCLSGSYIKGSNGARVTIADGGTGSNIVGSDGRSYGAATGQDLLTTLYVVPADTASERATRRRFCYYFIARTTSTRVNLGALAGSAAPWFVNM